MVDFGLVLAQEFLHIPHFEHLPQLELKAEHSLIIRSIEQVLDSSPLYQHFELLLLLSHYLSSDPVLGPRVETGKVLVELRDSCEPQWNFYERKFTLDFPGQLNVKVELLEKGVIRKHR